MGSKPNQSEHRLYLQVYALHITWKTTQEQGETPLLDSVFAHNICPCAALRLCVNRP